MTGYSSVYEYSITDMNAQSVPLDNLAVVNFVIHDGKRVNLTDDYVVTVDWNLLEGQEGT